MAYVSLHRNPDPSFDQPENGSVQVSRYLDMARLVAILANRRLPFVRIDLFDDRFEGSVPPSVHAAFANPEVQAAAAEERQWFRQLVYASCWHLGNVESEAMWRLYCGQGDGVALQTTYERLDASLPRRVRLGMVRYREYDESWPAAFPLPMLNFAMHKRSAFEHEKEVRAIILAGQLAESRRPGAASVLPPAILVNWDVEDVVEHVFVSPYAQDWYKASVFAVLERFAPRLAQRVDWSHMRTDPMY